MGKVLAPGICFGYLLVEAMRSFQFFSVLFFVAIDIQPLPSLGGGALFIVACSERP